MNNNKLAIVPKYLFILSAVALILSWLIPNHYLPWTSFYNEYVAAIALLLVATATLLDDTYPRDWVIPAPAIVLFLVVLIPLLQFSIGLIHFSGDAWISSLYLAGLLLAYLTGHRLTIIYGPEIISRYIASIFLIGGIISLFLVLHQWLRTGQLGIWLFDLVPNDRPHANLAQPNHLATLFCLALTGLLYLHEKKSVTRIIFYLVSTLMLFGISLTSSRTAILIIAVLIIWWGISKKKLHLHTSIPALVIGSLIFIFFISTTPALTELLYLDSHQELVGKLAESSSDIRLSIWRGLLDAIMQKPLLGYGWNQVTYAQVAIAAEHPQTLAVHHSHNLLIDLLIWNGPIIGGLLALMIVGWLFSHLRQCASIETWFFLLAVMIVGTHSLLEFPLYYTYFLVPIGLCAGSIDKDTKTTRLRFKSPVIAMVLLFGWLLIALVFPEYQRVRNDFTNMRFEQVDIEEKLPPIKSYDSPLFNQLTEITRYARTEATENMSEAELQWMETIAHRYTSPASLMRYAIALALNYKNEKAAVELKRLQRMHAPEHIQEAIQGWCHMAEDYPQLLLVELPEIPTNTKSSCTVNIQPLPDESAQ